MLKGAALPLFAAMARNKQTVTIPAVNAVFDAVGVKPAKVMADIEHLARKHPEHFTGADDVERHLTHVFGGAPDATFPASADGLTLLARDAGAYPVPTGEAYRSAVTDFTGQRNGNYWVRSTYPMSAEQLAVKKEKAVVRGASPGSEVQLLEQHLSGAKPAYASASTLPADPSMPQPANIGKTDLLGRADPAMLPWLAGGGLLGSYFLNQDANP